MLSIFKRRRFPFKIILLCVRWYCKYGISYRDLAEMMQERGVAVAHPPSSIGFSAMLQRSRSGSDPTKDLAQDPGEWMKHSAASG